MADRARALKQLLSKLASRVEPVSLSPEIGEVVIGPQAGCVFHGDPLLKEFVRSFLLWETTTVKAGPAFERVCRAVVDVNELRASLIEEIADLFGRGYARADERALRLKASLNDIYGREHRVRLDHVAAAGKKGALAYLSGLNQTPRFIAARTALVGLGVHAMPVDGRMLAMLVDAGVIEPGTDADTTAAWIEKQVSAGELRAAYALLQAASDAFEAKGTLRVTVKRPRVAAKAGAAAGSTAAGVKPPPRKRS